MNDLEKLLLELYRSPSETLIEKVCDHLVKSGTTVLIFEDRYNNRSVSNDWRQDLWRWVQT